jgi:hypothetical protein
VPRVIGAVISTSADKAATLHLLDTALSVEDLYDLLEISAVDAYNRRIIAKREM